MTKIIKDIKNHYVNIDQQLIRDESLSWKARGIFMYLWSQTDEWDFYAKEVAKHAPDGIDALNSGLDELEKGGYLTRERKRDKQGQLRGTDWILHEKPKKASPKSKTPKLDFPTQDKPIQDKPIQEKPIQENPNLSITNLKNYQLKELSTKSKYNVGLSPDHASEKNKTESKKQEQIPYAEIIDYLNKKAGTHYRASSKATQRLIKARWNEGFKPEDFKKVIDVKTYEWLNDANMCKYLRPETLFGTKFEGYLNEQRPYKGQSPHKEQTTDWEHKQAKPVDPQKLAALQKQWEQFKTKQESS